MNDNKIDISVKHKIAKILNLPDTTGWIITDFITEKGLYCIHYDRYADMIKYGHLRGIVVDVINNLVVCKSYGYTPNIELEEIEFDGDQIKLRDVSNCEHTLDISNVKFKIGYESTVIRVWKHDGDIYTSTHRRINPDKSRWGSSIPFKKMYENLNGPTTELFGDEPYSPWCHIFLMVHPEILIATKLPVKNGFLVYLEPHKMWDPEDTIFDKLKGFSPNDLLKPKEPKNMVTKQPESDSAPVVFKSSNISMEEANRHLKYGFYETFKMSDRRLETGEFIILTENDSSGDIKRTFKVSSIPYMWRSEMRDNNPNIYHRFFQLADGQFIDTKTSFGFEQYVSKFPLLTHYDSNEIKTMLNGDGFVTWAQKDETSSLSVEKRTELLENNKKRLYNIWQCYIASVPLCNQEKVSEMLTDYENVRYKTIKWLQEIESSNVVTDNISSEYSDRVKNIIDETRKYAQVINKRGVSTRYKNMKELVNRNIYELIMKEGGFSLYRLIKLMNTKEQELNKKE